MKRDHMQVLKTLHSHGLISRQAMKSYRGQVLAIPTHAGREAYLQNIIQQAGRRKV